MEKTINVKEQSKELRLLLKKELESFLEKPKLVVIQAGNNSASEVYIKSKSKACFEIGINFELIKYENKVEERVLINKIKELNNDDSVHGVLLQLPLFDYLNEYKLISFINPNKDVDGLTEFNLGKLINNQDGLYSCTASGIIKILDNNINLEGKHVVIVGRSILVGKPLIHLCLNKNATVTICHSKTKNISNYTKQADILIVAVGKKNFINANMIKKGVVLIDVGINREGNKLYGDIDYEDVYSKCSLITPVPGGVGIMTVTMLLYNIVEAYKKIRKENENEIV